MFASRVISVTRVVSNMFSMFTKILWGFHTSNLTHGLGNQPTSVNLGRYFLINRIGSVNSRPSSWEMLHFLARKIEKLTVKKSPPISESLPIHVQQIRHSDHSGYDSGNVGLCAGLVSMISLQPMWGFGDEPGDKNYV